MYSSVRSRFYFTFGNFMRCRRGGVLLLFAGALMLLLLAVGCVIDFARLSAARTTAQAAADAGALAAAQANSESQAVMSKAAEDFVRANTTGMVSASASFKKLTYTPATNDITVVVEGAARTSIMSIVNIWSLPFSVTASATRNPVGSTEVVLVLDNTWSMSGSKLDALKKSASSLVATLKKDPKSDVRIGLVPYADYVNVGVGNRNRSWISVVPDYQKTIGGACETVAETCTESCSRGPAQTCTRVVDGVTERYDCTPKVCGQKICTPITPVEQCAKSSIRYFKWYGCVYSRNIGDLRLSDGQPDVPYKWKPRLDWAQVCPNPIVPLTDSLSTVTSAINSMVVNIGGYRPETYIPAGMIWGVNVLSPGEPFSDGKAYDPDNRKPRKALVLMTDGTNTMRYEASDGSHLPTTKTSDIAQTYADMLAICNYAKQKKIDVFTVSFAVADEQAKAAMQNCSSGAGFAFNADNEQALTEAFKNIAGSLSKIRLTR
ncbi:vWA domain-containing protein [Bosea lathyri]|uniref:Flp pilus assembly protein TadG n=1 Tax=Bosea lathyri TaxID=1036778 RepID=A0A1H5TZ36_9HYPH|nr:VWA domain-containing protein [Bosea lathyri]SEF68095.1 Flp pilus assembly protein TadG [Bosea lathyri]